MFDFDDDNDFDLEDLIEADIKYGLFEDDEIIKKAPEQKKKKSFWDISKLRLGRCPSLFYLKQSAFVSINCFIPREIIALHKCLYFFLVFFTVIIKINPIAIVYLCNNTFLEKCHF